MRGGEGEERQNCGDGGCIGGVETGRARAAEEVENREDGDEGELEETGRAARVEVEGWET